jgi:ubiquinone biosynthesis protein
MTIPDGDAVLGPDPADLAFGAFSSDPPWVLDLDRLSWSAGIDDLRARTRADAPRLTRARRFPPGSRVVRVGALLGTALAAWYVGDRRRGQHRSRAGLSRRLRRAFERLGPTYIKLGQILSSGEGLFPEELVAEFRFCRDQVPAEPFAVVRAIVEADLGKTLEQQFSEFERTPVAAASVAQVHAARLRS